MNERDSLLANIRANPGDDAPRLVYADWLQENGQEGRAEFIRLQIQLSKLPPCGRCDNVGELLYYPHGEPELLPCPDCERWPMSGDAAELLSEHEKEWSTELGEPTWSRGFIETIDVPWEAWEAHGGGFADEPSVVLRRVNLTTEVAFGSRWLTRRTANGQRHILEVTLWGATWRQELTITDATLESAEDADAYVAETRAREEAQLRAELPERLAEAFLAVHDGPAPSFHLSSGG